MQIYYKTPNIPITVLSIMVLFLPQKTEAKVVQEGKDVVVQLAPTTPEKDYGQSSPEDSDMYTTRG